MIKSVEQVKEIPKVSVLLNIMKLFNEDVYDHCISVASITIAILEQCGNQFDEATHDDIIIGAALHDIGKILVPLNLTSSPRTFTQNERSIMEMHTLIGAEMLKEDFSQTVVDVCLYHHEQPNGDGYTEKLCLKDIPEGALIVKVADEYDALVSKRTYKSNYDKPLALQIMDSDSKKFKLDDGYFKKLVSALDEGLEI